MDEVYSAMEELCRKVNVSFELYHRCAYSSDPPPLCSARTFSNEGGGRKSLPGYDKSGISDSEENTW